MITKVSSIAYYGITAYDVEIEADVSFGLPQFQIVGLPDISIKESRERVRAAIKNSGFQFPPEKITINLAPADIKKEGALFDLGIALGILASSETIEEEKLKDYIFLGELALDGSLRPIKGTLVMTSKLSSSKKIILPAQNAKEAALQKNTTSYGFNNLKEVVSFIMGDLEMTPTPFQVPTLQESKRSPTPFDFSEVHGQYTAKRALEIAVAGGHNVLLIGSPGSGKSMLAKRIPSILPPLEHEEALNITKIHSLAGILKHSDFYLSEPPFRSPHHASSLVALTGGGSWPKPGEISLAHHGVLFLDEFPEFRRDALEALRSPLEEGEIHISRAKLQVVYPASVMLIAAMNPCPCGYLADPKRTCTCSMRQIQKYKSKISGPILDRIDLHVEVRPIPIENLIHNPQEESSESIRQRIIPCRKKQTRRYQNRPFNLNTHMRSSDIKKYAEPDQEGKKLLTQAMKHLHLSARAYYKILKVARTIADLEGKDHPDSEHIAEAIQYRSLDRQFL